MVDSPLLFVEFVELSVGLVRYLAAEVDWFRLLVYLFALVTFA